MRRPLFVSGVVMLAFLFVFFLVDSRAFAAVFSAAALTFAALVFAFYRGRKRLLLITVGVFAALSAVSFIAFEELVVDPALSWIGNGKEITAVLTDYPEDGENRVYVEARLDSGASLFPLRCRLSISKDDFSAYLFDAEPSDTVSFTGNIYRLGRQAKKYEDSFKSRSLVIGAYPTGIIRLEKAEKMSPAFVFKALRHSAEQRFVSDFEGVYPGIASAVMFGGKALLDRDVYSSFKSAGAAHILAVSGLHLSIFILFLKRLFALLGFRERSTSVVLIVFLFFFTALTGFSPSVCRAGLMMLLYLAAPFFFARSDGLNSLGFAVTVLLLFRPSFSINAGFLLSVFATAGIFMISRPVIDCMDGNSFLSGNKALRLFLEAGAISFGATVFTFPFSVFFFGEAAVLSLLTNLLIFPVCAPMILSFGLYQFVYFLPFVGGAVKLAAKLLSSYCVAVCGAVSGIPFSVLRLEGGAVYAAVILSAAFAVGLAVLLKRAALRKKQNHLSYR